MKKKFNILKFLEERPLSWSALSCFDNPDYRFIKHWKKGLHPIIEVSRHDIGTSKIEFILSSIMEVVSSAVLQKTTDNTDDPDMFTDSRNTWLQTAYPANDKINLHPFAGCPVESPNGLGIHQGIHFHNDSPLHLLSAPLDLPFNHLNNPFAGIDRRDKKLSVLRMF